MNIAVISIMVICAILYLSAAVWTLMRHGARRRTIQRRNLLQDKYLLILTGYLYERQTPDGRFPFPQYGGRRSKMLLAETIAAFSAMNYGYDFTAMRKIVTYNDVDTFLFKRIKRSRSWYRIRYMQLLSLTGARDALLTGIKHLEKSENPYESLFALLIRISSAPELTVKSIREFPGTLSRRALPEIMLQLRRGFIPVAYEPMIRSNNENLKLLGIYIIRCFGIEDAQDILYSLLDYPSSAVQDSALYALAAMKCSMAQKKVVESVSGLSFFQRRRLYKFLAAEGYSSRSLSALQSSERDSRLGGYMESLVNSYKRMLQ